MIQRIAMVPETISCDGPAGTTAPGTGPIAIANADRAVSVVTLPSGLICPSTDCQAVKAGGEEEGGLLERCDEHAASDATASAAATRMLKVRGFPCMSIPLSPSPGRGYVCHGGRATRNQS